MRDPQGQLSFDGSRALRQLNPPHQIPTFLTHPLARQLVDAGLLVPFDIKAPDLIESPRYPFISLPTEWCDLQHSVAAELTLLLAERVLAAGFELKDASAWNVIFEGSAARFCDHLSVAPVVTRQWWAFGQFCRHFTFPLACSHWRGMHTHATFAAHRDGLGTSQARALLGLRGRLSRLAPLLLRAQGTASADSDFNPDNQPVPAKPVAGAGGSLHPSLIKYCRHSLLSPRQAGAVAQPQTWSGYIAERPHYTEDALQTKLAQMAQWMAQLQPRTVLDLGCNTGEFSRLALAQAGTQRVVAVDADHDCVQQVFANAAGSTRLHALVANLGDMHGGRGWAATEFTGLLDRLDGQSDLVLMLALVHHLHFSEGIPLPRIAELAARMSRRHLVVELLDSDDPMVMRLAAQRRREPDGFTIEQQLAAFGSHFELLERLPLAGTRRVLALMRRRP